MSSCSRGVASLVNRVAARPLVPRPSLTKAPWAVRSSSNTSPDDFAQDSAQPAAQEAPLSPDDFSTKASQQARVRKPKSASQSGDIFARHLMRDLEYLAKKKRSKDAARASKKVDEKEVDEKGVDEKEALAKPQPLIRVQYSRPPPMRISLNELPRQLGSETENSPEGELPQEGTKSQSIPPHFNTESERIPYVNRSFQDATVQKLPTPPSTQHRLVIFAGLLASIGFRQFTMALNEYLMKQYPSRHNRFRIAGLDIRPARDGHSAVAFSVFHSASGAMAVHEAVRNGDFEVMGRSVQSSIHPTEDMEQLQQELVYKVQTVSGQTTHIKTDFQETTSFRPIKLIKPLVVDESANATPQNEAVAAVPGKTNGDGKADQVADLTDAGCVQKVERPSQDQSTDVQNPKEAAS